MDPIEYYQSSIEEFDKRINVIQDNQWGNPTPDTDWNVKALVNHVVYEILWAGQLLNGKTLETVGNQFEGDILGNDPKLVWKKAKEELDNLVKREILNNKVTLSYGEVTIDYYIRELSSDILIHTWDLAIGINDDDVLPDYLCKYTYELLIPKLKGYKEMNLFKASLDIEENSDWETKILAITGRRRN